MSDDLAALDAELGADDPERRRHALRHLLRLDPADAAHRLLLALGDRDWRVRKEAVGLGGALASEAIVDALAGALGEADDVGLRNAAVEALVRCGGARATRAAARVARGGDADARKLAVEVLAELPSPESAEVLLEVLAQDDDPNVVAAAAAALGRASRLDDDARDLAVRALLARLGDADVSLRAAALEALGALGARPAFAELAACVAHPLTRAAALALVAAERDPQGLRAACEALEEGPAALFQAGARAAARAGEPLAHDPSGRDELRRRLRARPDVLERLRALLAEAPHELRGAALVLLGLAGDPDDLVAVAEATDDPDVADRAELALTLFGDEARSSVRASAARPDDEHAVTRGSEAFRRAPRASLVVLATSSASPPEGAASAARAALSDGRTEVLTEALRVLGALGDGADAARLVEHVVHPDEAVRAVAGEALRTLARRFPSDLPRAPDAPVRRGLRAPDDDGLRVSVALWHAYVVAGRATAAALAGLDEALGSGPEDVRAAAAVALGDAGDTAREPSLLAATTDESARVVRAAVHALGALGATARLAALAADDALEAAGPALLALAALDPERAAAAARASLAGKGAAAAAAVDALASLPPGLARDPLASAAQHPDPAVAAQAVAALAPHGGDDVLAVFCRALEHPDARVRAAATAGLAARLPDDAARDALRARLDRELDPRVRRALAAALEQRAGR